MRSVSRASEGNQKAFINLCEQYKSFNQCSYVYFQHIIKLSGVSKSFNLCSYAHKIHMNTINICVFYSYEELKFILEGKNALEGKFYFPLEGKNILEGRFIPIGKFILEGETLSPLEGDFILEGENLYTREPQYLYTLEIILLE